MMLNPTLKLLCLGSPVIITSFYISGIVSNHLDVTIIALNFVFKLFNCGRVVTQELSTGKEVTALAVIFVTFYAVENKEREHLISKKTPS